MPKETNVDKLATKTGVRTGAADLSEAELETIDTITPGTAVANKAAILGANKNLDVLALASLRLGSGAGTAVTATAAELNKLASAGATVASGTQAAHAADVSAPAALTSAQISGGEAPTEAEFNALQADVAALRATVAALVTAQGGVYDSLEAFRINAAS